MTRPTSPRRVTLAVLLGLLASCGGGAGGSNPGPGTSGPTTPAAPATPVQVRVDTAQVLRIVDSGAILGGNLGIWVTPADLRSPTDGYLVERGARVLRGPGGNLSNNYCWVTQRVSNNDHVVWDDWSWGLHVEDYLDVLARIDGRALFSLNPFDHTVDGEAHSAAGEARALVRLMVSRGQAGALYEVGNENDGSWNRMLTSEEYVEAFIALAEAVKGEDASAQMMGPAGSGETASWRDGFLDGLAARGKLGLLDYFSFHYYGGWISNSNSYNVSLSNPQLIPGFVADIRARLDAVGAPDAGVALTEYNAAIWDAGATRGKRSIEQSLWLADTAGELFRVLDVGNVWIDLTGDDEHALLVGGSSPPARTTNYWPLYVVARTLGFGWRDPSVAVLSATTDRATDRVTAYAALGSDGRLGVLLVNKGDPLSAAVALADRGCSAVGALRYDADIHAAGGGPAELAASCSAGTVSVELPRLSVVGLVLESSSP